MELRELQVRRGEVAVGLRVGDAGERRDRADRDRRGPDTRANQQVPA
jgi:hypothetical protein